MAAHLQYQQMRAAPLNWSPHVPFTDTRNQLPAVQPAGVVSPVKSASAQQKNPASPPLPRQNTKTAPPSPPQVIRDTSHSESYSRVGFLGEGGFARVYEVQDRAGTRQAIKVVTRDSLKTKKAKTKLYAEIKIHRSLHHPNIVRFSECFEDDENVYMTLELCESGSLMDMLRRRRRFTEPEARFYLIQLIGACHYMHTNQVIHRDLKLGNLFLDSEMNIKVGDFGLAALIENPGERKKTICGTPNYIAPEVLFDTANGHSFEVDTWSIGVILYTLVIGRPPFQTKEVKTIYKRIRDNEYDFPPERPVSLEVQDLIQQILTHDPQKRPTLHDIVDHRFFTHGIVPPYIPRTAQDRAPDFRHIGRAASLKNLEHLRKSVLLDDEHQPINVPSSAGTTGRGKASSASATNNASMLSSSVTLAQQEREFQRAVQPSSPISALLGAARQPLVMAAAGSTGNGREREQPLIRKLQAVAKESRSSGQQSSGSRTSSLAMSATGYTNGHGHAHAGGLQDIEEEDYVPETREEELMRRKELEAQKARIVAQMTSEPIDDVENIPRKTKTAHLLPKQRGSSSEIRVSKVSFRASALAHRFVPAGEDYDLPDAKVFIVSWVDYCNKYGMGYALTDGSVGVHFNDSTSIVLSPDKHNVDYITSKLNGAAYSRQHHTLTKYTDELKSKCYLLKHFERYIMERLYGEYPFTYEDVERAKGMDFVQKYLRMKHVIVFKLSNDVLQFNFYDHTKVILSSQGLLVTHINKDYELTRWPLSELMTLSLRPPEDPVEAKFVQRLVDKLKYCKEVLLSIKNVSTSEPSSPTSSGNGAKPGQAL
ncbi:Pkinase-domain-containing protein [Phellopilus nigrolimitatus]|nr:Pkinase-domain-containing protein [Phellopilus nigrolimitatus]